MTDFADRDHDETVATTAVDLARAWDNFIPLFAGRWGGIEDPPPPDCIPIWTQRPDVPTAVIPARLRELLMDAVDRAEPIRYEIQVCAVELRNQLVQLDFEMWASTHQEEVLSEFPWWNKGLNLFHRFIEDHVDMFGPDFVEACRKIRVLLIDLNEMYWPFSSLPTGLVILREENGESPFIPGRLYLDVTDATLADVQHIWTYVDLMQRTMPGSTTKRRQGRAPGAHSSEVSRWIARAQEIGEAAALVEFKAEGDGARGDWQRRYQWWYRRVRPLLR